MPWIVADRASERHPLELYAFRINAPDLTGSFLNGAGDNAGWRFFPLAYSSFSPAHVHDSRAVLPMPRVATAGTFNQHTASPYWGKWSDLSTPWMATLHRVDAPGVLLAGALEARVGLCEVALRRRRPTQLELRWDLGGRRLQQDARLEGDPFLLAFSTDGDALLRDYTAEVARRMQARVPQGSVPAGWCSWYYYYTGVTEAAMHHNLEALEASRDALPVRYVQLDDGYQAHVGDWLTVNNRFATGLEALAQHIRRRGFVPGIWTAPFLVQRSSEVFRRHPDWLLKQPDGRLERLGYHPAWGLLDGQVYSLDPTHPEVLAHLTHVFSTLVAFGYDYFKIDFLFAGLQTGRHFDAGRSPVEAYRMGLECIRAAIGDRFLLGCGAPLLPSIGLVDAMRISPDVKEDWRDLPIALLANGNGHPSAELCILNSLTRAHLHGVWWLNDPDCLLVRERRSSLRIVEVQTLISVLSLTGGMLFLSDDLRQLEPTRRALAELALPPGGTSARTPGLQDEARPSRFVRTQVGPEGRLEALAAVINWSEEVVTWDIAPTELELEDQAYHVFAFWSNSWHRLAPGETLPVTLDPHETALLLLRPATSHPQVITATHHLGQTTVLLAEERWDPAGRLQIQLELEAVRSGAVWVAIPDGFQLLAVNASGGARLLEQRRIEGGVRLEVALERSGTLELEFSLAPAGKATFDDHA